MSAFNRRFAFGLLALSLAAPALAGPPVVKGGGGSDVWFTMGGGYYDGQDYSPQAGGGVTDAEDTEGLELVAALTVVGDGLFRVRASWMTNYTSNTAEEVAGLVGLPLGKDRKTYLAAGISRLTDVSAEQQSPTIGVPVELLYYPARGLEIGLHGNFNPDSNFVGITIGGVFGKRRLR